jgi:hypothetical protein
LAALRKDDDQREIGHQWRHAIWWRIADPAGRQYRFGRDAELHYSGTRIGAKIAHLGIAPTIKTPAAPVSL